MVEEEPATALALEARRRGEWAPRGLGQTWEDVGGSYQSPGHPRRGGDRGVAVGGGGVAARVTARSCEMTRDDPSTFRAQDLLKPEGEGLLLPTEGVGRQRW